MTVIEGSLATLLGLAVLWLGLLAGLVLLPAVLLAGYAARIIEESLYEDVGAPPFRPGATMGYEGLKETTVAGVYLAVPLVVAGGTALRTGSLTSGVGRFGLLAALLLAVPCWYVGAAGLVNYVRMGRVIDAFRYRRFDHVVTGRAYARHWLAALALVAAAGLATAVLVQIPLAVRAIPVGVVPAAVAVFYAICSASYLYATGFAEAWAQAESTEKAAAEAAREARDVDNTA